MKQTFSVITNNCSLIGGGVIIILLLIVFGGAMILDVDDNKHKYSNPDVDYKGDIIISNETIHFDGVINGFDWGIPRDYHNVTFCMYGENGNVLKSYKIGTISPGGPPPKVQFTATVVPYYVIIRGSDFWSGREPTVWRADYFVRDRSVTRSEYNQIEGYEERSASSPEEYPVAPVKDIC